MAGRVRRLVAFVCLCLTGVLTACGTSLGTATNVGEPLANGAEPANEGDTSPRKVVEAGEQVDATGSDAAEDPVDQTGPDLPSDASENDESAQSIRLEPLEQPESKFPDPKLPGKPAEDSEEITHLSYLLESSAWVSAGVVDENTETDCGIDSDKLAEPGKYDFTCTVSFSGVSVKYQVNAEVKDKTVPTKFSTDNLPVSEEKAVYEATRQSFKPARVTCDIVGVETIRVGQNDGFTCWVTDVENARSTYIGEVLPDGQLALRQQ